MSDLPFNEFLVVVAVTGSRDVSKGRGHLILRARVDADTGMRFPDPPPTIAEMQHVAYAAKMALITTMLARKKKARKRRS